MEEGGQARHLRKIDLKHTLFGVLRQQCRLAQMHTLGSQGCYVLRKSALHDRGLERMPEMPRPQAAQAFIEEAEVGASVRDRHETGKASHTPNACAKRGTAVSDPSAQRNTVRGRAPRRA